MSRTLFCQLGPLAYRLSQEKEILWRKWKNIQSRQSFARERTNQFLPVTIIKHNSLIRRRLGNIDLTLQENKAITLSIAAPLVNGVLIRPGETFSFWELVGRCTRRKGYLEGVTISNGAPKSGIGGGMCQFTNLLHWMVLHSDLTIVEHHHHNGLDLFPDFNRKIPFGTGTSIVYNYLDYRVQNRSSLTYQFVVYTTDEYLCGELRADAPLPVKIHIHEEDAYFFERGDSLFRHNKIYRRTVDKRTGNTLEDNMILENTAKVMYSKELVDAGKIITR